MLEDVRRYLSGGDLGRVFNRLGWNSPTGLRQVVAGDRCLTPVAAKAGVAVYESQGRGFPTGAEQRIIAETVRLASTFQAVIVHTDPGSGERLYQWPAYDHDTRRVTISGSFLQTAGPAGVDKALTRLAAARFHLSEERSITAETVMVRCARSFDSDSVTPPEADAAANVLTASSTALTEAVVALIERIGGAAQTGGKDHFVLPGPKVIVETVSSLNGSDGPTPWTLPENSRTASLLIDMHNRDNGQREQWLALVTDGTGWEGWLHEHNPPTGSHRFPPAGRRQRFEGDPEGLVRWLRPRVWRDGILPTVPEHMGQFLKPYEADVKKLADEATGEQRVVIDTQRYLWHEMLSGSGMAPESADSHTSRGLFAAHTLLQVVTETVTQLLAGGERSTDVGTGYATWVGLSERGQALIASVRGDIASYDWRKSRKDVLRRVYMEMISKEHRKAFGEYYTPDWLAEMLVEEALDEQWLGRVADAGPERVEHLVASGVGVLDPTCGSGTFLFHAARRIVAYLTDSGWSDRDASEAASRLVVGMDIHPVAAPIARATLLSALPRSPSGGADGVRVSTGDALLAPVAGGGLLERSKAGDHRFVSPKARVTVELPGSITRRTDILPLLRRVVHSAHRGDESPPSTLEGFNRRDRVTLVDAHAALKEVIAAEGNGVWAWWMACTLISRSLSERKVDRIVANPPWVRMSEIQVESRKQLLELMIDDPQLNNSHLSLNPGTTGGLSSFDICALFIVRCRELFLADSGTGERSLWLGNAAASRSRNWAGFRQRTAELEGRWSFTPLDTKKKPFEGADSCVITHNPGPGSDLTGIKRLVCRQGLKIAGEEPWAEVKPRLRFENIPILAEKPSAYTRTVRGKPSALARNGATIFPQSLVVIAETVPTGAGEMAVRTIGGNNHAAGPPAPGERKGKATWAKIAPRNGVVPEQWVRPVVYSKNLFNFVTGSLVDCLIPTHSDTGDIDHQGTDSNRIWQTLNDIYSQHCGLGRATPKTLLGLLDFQGNLTAQLEGFSSISWLVIHNKSGGILRATRTANPVIIENGCYWMELDSEGEAGYLTALLNADVLQPAYAASRISDRHFDTHQWTKVPIPRYNPADPDHMELADLCTEAEKQATAAVNAHEQQQEEEAWARAKRYAKRTGLPIQPPDVKLVGQQKACKIIRETLRQSGIAARIDHLARRVVPVEWTVPPSDPAG